MICRRIATRLSCNRRYLLWINPLNGRDRWVHSTNVHEIDYLVSRYKLSNRNTNQMSGHLKTLNTRLAYFNTINDFSYKTEKEITADCLKSLLNIKKSEAKKLVRNYPILTETDVKNLEKQFKSLSSQYSLRTDQFLSCPWILYLPLSFVKERLTSCGTQDITNDYLVLLLLPFPSFQKFVKKLKNKLIENFFEDFDKRLNYFTEKLNLSHEEFCDLIYDNMFLFKYDFKRLENIMELLLSSGIDPNLIAADIHIFKHNIELMRSRIAECDTHKMPVKTWMLRSAPKEFYVCLRRHLDSVALRKDLDSKGLKDNNENVEYLANQLSCKKPTILSMMKRYPRIVNISAKKLTSIIGFLFENGFSTYDVIKTPKILFHNIDKIDKRIKELAQINLIPNALTVLTLSDEEFNKLNKKLKSSDISENNDILFKSRLSN